MHKINQRESEAKTLIISKISERLSKYILSDEHWVTSTESHFRGGIHYYILTKDYKDKHFTSLE